MSQNAVDSTAPNDRQISIQVSSDERLIRVKLSGGPWAEAIIRMLETDLRPGV